MVFQCILILIGGFNPFDTQAQVKLDYFSNFRAENNTYYLKPTTRKEIRSPKHLIKISESSK